MECADIIYQTGEWSGAYLPNSIQRPLDSITSHDIKYGTCMGQQQQQGESRHDKVPVKINRNFPLIEKMSLEVFNG